MAARERYRIALATLLLFTVAAGDFWRNLIGWGGWGALSIALLVACIVELAHDRPAVRRLPLPLLGFLAFAALSLLWARYRLAPDAFPPSLAASPAGVLLARAAPLAGVLASAAMTTGAAFLALCLPARRLVAVVSAALTWVLALSIVFELVVALVIRHRIFALFPAFDTHAAHIPRSYYWSRDVLFTGGRIQGIVGNSNLLAMIALLALVVLAVQAAARTIGRAHAVAGIALALACLALTRSATVIACAVAVVLVLAVVLLVRRTTGAARAATTWGALAALALVVVAVIAFRAPLLAALGKSADLTYRVRIWGDVTALAAQHPVLGWGWVSYWIPWVTPFDHLAVIGGVTYLQAHDAWLDVWFQLGAVGLAIFVAFVLSTLVRAWWTATDRPQSAPGPGDRYGVLSLLPILLLTALVVQSLAESRLLVELGWTLLAATAIALKRARSGALDPRRRPARDDRDGRAALRSRRARA